MKVDQSSNQEKKWEIAFFSEHAKMDEYNVFTEECSRSIAKRCVDLSGLNEGNNLVLDLGCGSGVFGRLLQIEHGVKVVGLDISYSLTVVGRQKYPEMDFVTGDAEFLPLLSGMLDGVLLSGLIHHFPNPTKLAAEVYRVLRTGGRFVAFDPNRINPFMWLYRDKTSPFYSNNGVTPNERPIIAEQVMNIFSTAGFEIAPPDYISPSYQYIASPRLRVLLAFYNAIESLLFRPEIMKSFRAIVITHGTKT